MAEDRADRFLNKVFGPVGGAPPGTTETIPVAQKRRSVIAVDRLFKRLKKRRESMQQEKRGF